MSDLKTKPGDTDINSFLSKIMDAGKREDCSRLLNIMEDITGEVPRIWGGSMVGFGTYHYKYASGREGDWFLTGFAPRKQNLTLYIMAGFDEFDTLMQKLGKFKTGKSCLYVKRLDDLNEPVLRSLITKSVDTIRMKYPQA